MSDAAQVAIEREAAAYVRDAKFYYEWEGDQDGPFDEAASAVAYVTAHPQSTLRPYLDVFVLHRYRCAFEAAGWEAAHGKTAEMTDAQGAAKHVADLSGQRRAASLYRDLWDRVSGG